MYEKLIVSMSSSRCRTKVVGEVTQFVPDKNQSIGELPSLKPDWWLFYICLLAEAKL
jgi:hypothetical protein